jgi:hypothetical protein
VRVEEIARICHEVNRGLCNALGETSREWAEVSPSVIEGVKKIVHAEVTRPEQSHESWYNRHVAEGWTYGPVKDSVAKTHPCLLPYNELPATQRLKDILFMATVRALS